MAKVEFLQGTEISYLALEEKEPTTFYLTEKNFYIGDIKLSNAADVANNIEEIMDDIGNLTDLDTEDKTSVIAAINEILDKFKETKVTIEESSAGEEYVKAYTIKQNNEVIGTINIPKDMVVESGTVEVDPEGQEEGTYIVLTLANATNDKIYVNVGSLVDIYVAEEEAAQVQLTINPITREISASIVNGSVGTSQLADGGVTLAKLAEDAVGAFDEAGAAEQALTDAKTYAQQLMTWGTF